MEIFHMGSEFIYRVDEPTNLDDTIDFLMSKGFPKNENLRTTELEEVECERGDGI